MPGPLAGVKVVDFSTALAGPMAAGLMGDMGADVIKIEPPGLGDVVRFVGPSVGGISAIYQHANRSKRAISIDVATDDGRELALQFCDDADVVVQNFRPGVADRLGIGWDALRARNADVILVAVNGFGSDGPYADRPAYDTVIQALAGLTHVEGDDGDARNLRQLASDKITALYAANGALAALAGRERGLGGQLVEVPMLEANLHFVWMDGAGNETLEDFLGDQPSSPASTMRPIRCADGWIFPTQVAPKQFVGWCGAFGVDVPEEEASIFWRQANPEVSRERNEAVIAAIAQTPTAEVVDRLVTNDVPVGWSLDPADQPSDPHLAERGVFRRDRHPVAGSVVQPRLPMSFSETAAEPGVFAPEPGRDTDALLAELGRDPGPLRESGVVE